MLIRRKECHQLSCINYYKIWLGNDWKKRRDPYIARCVDLNPFIWWFATIHLVFKLGVCFNIARKTSVVDASKIRLGLLVAILSLYFTFCFHFISFQLFPSSPAKTSQLVSFLNVFFYLEIRPCTRPFSWNQPTFFSPLFTFIREKKQKI